jgi:hypothetical protein
VASPSGDLSNKGQVWHEEVGYSKNILIKSYLKQKNKKHSKYGIPKSS